MNSNNKDVAEYSGESSGNNNNGNKNNLPGKKINLPNKLTLFRIIIVPVIMIFILLPLKADENANIILWAKIIAAALFLIAALTDLIDGLLARRLNQITNFGKFMDAVADKFLIIGVLIAITA